MADLAPHKDEERWEAVAIGKVKLLQQIAQTITDGETVSSGWLAKRCGLSVEEWHGSGELITALMFFGVENGFLEWHAKDMIGPTPSPPDA